MADDLKALATLNDGYIRSVAKSDAAWFEQNLSDDFVNSNPDGTLSGRADFIARVARPLPLTEFRAEDVRIRLMGDAAIVHGRTVFRKADGQPGHGRYTDVYARRDGRWLCVCADVTRC
jgi:ketosteroid isomerase-like protein